MISYEARHQKWIERNPNGLRKLPYLAYGVSHKCIWYVVIDQLLDDDSFTALFLFIEESLTEMGMEFFYPGGNIQRRVCWLLSEVFGLEGNGKSEYFQNTAVQIGLDAMAEEITKRCQNW